MKRYFAYTRVSTVRQGEHGVSLQEQKEAIERYAARNGMQITEWFAERETAAKTGRPVFNQMLRLIKNGRAEGIIIHKIDRSARNLKDWAEIGQLAESGIKVHFANEAVDLSSSTGMLSADVQAVVAAHYIRNLREEVKKGYYGRLKQGLCPYPAPIGYRDCGAGKPKVIDPIHGPLVRRAFELYSTGRYSHQELTEELYRLGLRTKRQQKVSKNTIAGMLSNPFYYGELYIKKTQQLFAGIHEPLISKELFDKIQQVLSGKSVVRTRSHHFLFSRLIGCAICGRSLIAEAQKGHVYYRCHQRHLASLKEEIIEGCLSGVFAKIRLSPEEIELVDMMYSKKRRNWESESEQHLKSEHLRLAGAQERLDRLADAYLEGLLDKQQFEQKRAAFLLEHRASERRVSEAQNGNAFGLKRWDEIVELIKTAYSLYKGGSFDEKREMITKVMSNRLARGKSLEITMKFPFSVIAERGQGKFGGPSRGRSRTWHLIFKRIAAHFRQHPSDDLL